MLINKNNLIFFHFHGLNIYNYFFSTGLSMYNKKLKKVFVDHIYKKYVAELELSKNQIDIVETNIRQNIKFNEFYHSFILTFKKIIRILKQFTFLTFIGSSFFLKNKNRDIYKKIDIKIIKYGEIIFKL